MREYEVIHMHFYDARYIKRISCWEMNSQSHWAVLCPGNSRNRLYLPLILFSFTFALATAEFLVNIPKLCGF